MRDEVSECVRFLPGECSVIIIEHSSGRIRDHSLTASHEGLSFALGFDMPQPTEADVCKSAAGD